MEILSQLNQIFFILLYLLGIIIVILLFKSIFETFIENKKIKNEKVNEITNRQKIWLQELINSGATEYDIKQIAEKFDKIVIKQIAEIEKFQINELKRFKK